jgi:EmrB/QacA subfamily drug resistance transporter
LDSTVVNVALPAIARELDSQYLTDLEGQSYIYYGYLLTLSALLILAGALSDYHGHRRMFVIGLAGFGITSIMCGAAPTMETLIAARILQGATGAILVPGSLAIITTAFKDEEQGRAFGIWAGASAGTTILGPPIGGFLVGTVSWRAAFLINIPLVAIALWAAIKHVPESRDADASGRFDWLGAAVVALAVGGLTFGAIRGQAQAWQDPTAFVALAVGAASTIAFPILMRRSDHPLVPLDMFKSRNFSVTNISTLLIYGALYLFGQYLALFVIGTLDYNEVAFGVAGVPGTLFLVLFSSRFGALAVRYGPRIFMTIGPIVMAAGLVWLSQISADSDPWRMTGETSTWIPPADYTFDVLPGLLLFGAGIMIMVAPLTTALMRSVPPSHSGLASAVNNAISRVGPQLFGAILFIAITSAFYSALAQAVPNTRPESATLRQQVSPFNPPDDRSLQAEADDASADAFRLAMLVSAGLCVAGGIVNAVGIRNEQLHESDPVPEPGGAG